MPYYITDKAAGCSGWATIKADGEVIGCHTTKQDAIDQMVAVSISEGMEPGGERALPDNYRPSLSKDVPEGRACGNCEFYDEERVDESGEKAWCTRWEEFVEGDFYCNAWQGDEDRADAPAPAKDQITGSDKNKPGSASGKAGGIELTASTETALQNKATEHNDAMSERDRPEWTRVRLGALKSVWRRGAGAYSTSHRPGVSRPAWAMARVNAFLYLARTGSPKNSAYVGDNDLLHPNHPKYSKGERTMSLRQVDLTPPEYMVAAAKRGLRLYADGEAGDGLQPATVREARLMAQGEVSEDKWRRIGPWIARHLTDLKAVDEEGEITPGLVAHLLWGSGSTRSAALRAQRYAEDVVRRLNEEQSDTRGLEEGMYGWTPRQKYLYDELEDIAETFGKFDQGIGSEGAHYVAESPFANDGLVCSNCAFYAGPRACQIVDGDINPGGICKFWIIPNELVREETPVPLYRNKNVQVQIRKKEPVQTEAEVETRRVVIQDFECRETSDGGMTFQGYAAVFNSDSEPLPFTERIAPGAFDRTLKSKNNVKMYLNHDSTLVLASTRAKTLRLSVDNKGLLADADLPNTTYARDLSELIKRGDVDSMSFGFSVPRGGDTWNDEGTRRELREVRLHEVSVVTGFPAYKATSASLRSIDALAEATGMDANKLAEALTLLENGKELTDDYATMLSETISKLRVAPILSDKTNSLALKQKHLELLLKQF